MADDERVGPGSDNVPVAKSIRPTFAQKRRKGSMHSNGNGHVRGSDSLARLEEEAVRLVETQFAAMSDPSEDGAEHVDHHCERRRGMATGVKATSSLLSVKPRALAPSPRSTPPTAPRRCTAPGGRTPPVRRGCPTRHRPRAESKRPAALARRCTFRCPLTRANRSRRLSRASPRPRRRPRPSLGRVACGSHLRVASTGSTHSGPSASLRCERRIGEPPARVPWPPLVSFR